MSTMIHDKSMDISDDRKANATSLVFPSDDDLDGKERIPREAMELINSLLQEKQHRLCSEVYSRNDFRDWPHPNGNSTNGRSEKPPQDYQGHHVYPDDAVDIKAHPFFRGLSWDTIHLSKPPFVPDVRSQADTKYFDDDPISDVDDGTSEQDPSGDVNYLDDPRLGLYHAPEPSKSACSKHHWEESMNGRSIGQFGGDGPYGGAPKPRRRREKKRPRDRVLRDKEFGRKVLELRKRGAFLGYAYQRPATIVYDNERGRQGSASEF